MYVALILLPCRNFYPMCKKYRVALIRLVRNCVEKHFNNFAVFDFQLFTLLFVLEIWNLGLKSAKRKHSALNRID